MEAASFQGKWGTGENLACLRYMAVDAMTEAGCSAEQIAKVGSTLKAAFKADPELGYASNFQKLLVDCGDIKAMSEYD